MITATYRHAAGTGPLDSGGFTGGAPQRVSGHLADYLETRWPGDFAVDRGTTPKSLPSLATTEREAGLALMGPNATFATLEAAKARVLDAYVAGKISDTALASITDGLLARMDTLNAMETTR